MDLLTFLVELGKSPQLRDDFIKDPPGVCQQYGVSAADQEALRTGNHQAVDARLTGGAVAFWIIVPEWIIDPNSK